MVYNKKYSDPEIITEIRKGNKDVLVYLYRENYPIIRSYIQKNSGKSEDIEDVLQEAIVVVWQNVMKPEFELTSKLNTFLYAIAKNTWLKHLNKNKRQEPIADKHVQIHVTKESSMESMDSRIVVEYMQKLGDTCRDLLHLFYFDGLDMTEIAERLGFNNSDTAKAKKYQCFKKLEVMVKANYSRADF